MRSDGTREIRIHTTAVIQAQQLDRVWTATLPNGKEILAFRKPRQARVEPPLQAGTRVTVSLSLLDFSKGEVVSVER